MKNLIIASGILTLWLGLAPQALAKTATAVIKGTAEGSAVSGTVNLEETEQGLKISGQFSNVPPGKHGFHIHQLGHAHWTVHNENNAPVGLPPDVEDWRTAGPTKAARSDTP